MTTVVRIDPEACLHLLSGATFGRVALNFRALPRIVPVRFDVHRGQIHASAQGELEFGDALNGAVVALQADGHDEGTHQVWNVHIIGRVSDCYGRGLVISPGIIEGEWLPL